MIEVSLLKLEEETSYNEFLSSLPGHLVYPSLFFRNFLSEAGGDAVYLTARPGWSYLRYFASFS